MKTNVFRIILAACLVLAFLGCEGAGTGSSSDGSTGTETENAPLPTVTSVTVEPTTTSVAKGGTQTFTATVAGTNNPSQTVTWTVTGGAAGTTISANGTLDVAIGETAPALIVTATSTVDATKSGTSAVAVSGTATVSSVTVSPAPVDVVNVVAGRTQQFTAVVAGELNPSQTVTWTVDGGAEAGTTIGATGLLTVAAGETEGTTLTVTATSIIDTDKSGDATVTVVVPTVTSVTISPANLGVAKGGTQQFTAVVSGTYEPPQTVTWTVDGGVEAGTAMSATGLLTVDASEEIGTTLTVKATSTYDTGKHGETIVTVVSSPLTGAVTINGTAQVSYSLTANTSNLFGSGAVSYQWKRANTASAAGTDITGATGQSYTLDTDDVGRYISVTVRMADNSGTKTSDAKGPVLPAPASTGSVTGSITVTDGIENVTVSFSNANNFILSGSGSVTVTVSGSYQAYQWYVDGTALSGESGSSIVLYGTDFTNGSHRILVIVYHDGVPYSQEIRFTRS